MRIGPPANRLLLEQRIHAPDLLSGVCLKTITALAVTSGSGLLAELFRPPLVRKEQSPRKPA